MRLFYVKQLVRKPSISTLRPLRRSEFTFYCSLILRARRIYFPPFLVWFYRLPRIFVDVDERKQSGIYIKPSWLLLYLLSACRSWIPPKSIFHDWTPDDSLRLIVARRTSLCVDIFNSERCMLYIPTWLESTMWSKGDEVRGALGALIRPREFFPVFRARLNWPPPCFDKLIIIEEAQECYIVATIIVVITVNVTWYFFYANI